jgi:hypothetical protein
MFGKRRSIPATDHEQQLKPDDFNFNKIERFFLKSDKEDIHQVISDRTYHDLDLEDIFKFIDRTISSIGQQYLYHLLRTIPSDAKRSNRIEALTDIFQNDQTVKKRVMHEIGKLDNQDAYYISGLFLGTHLQKPKWFWLIQSLSLISISSVLLAFFFPKVLIFLIALFPVNLGIHYWNKTNLYQYASSIPQLLIMNQIAGKILKQKHLHDEKVARSVEELDTLGMSMAMSIFKIEAKLQSETALVVEYLLELIKGLFLIEPILLFKILPFLDSRRQQIATVFAFVGEMDAVISINHLRESVPYYCLPDIISHQKQLHTTGSYHPLIYHSVSNDLDINGRSSLLTGSNMSGKTTFIRTIGINAILGQSIHTCFAEKFAVSRIKIHAAIRMSDDLLDNKSYYFEEVLTIKNLLEESHLTAANLFLLDEVFKGTNTIERIAAGKAIVSYLNKKNNIVLVSTHDLELAAFLKDTFDLYHFTEMIQANEILFDYKIKSGNLKTTNAIRILSMNAYPEEVIEEAILLADQIQRTQTEHL